MSLTIAVAEIMPGFLELSIAGRLDSTAANQLEREFHGLMEQELRALRINMANVSYVSSMGLRAIFMVSRALKSKGAACQLVSLQPQVLKVFEIVKALPDLGVFASIEEADAYFDAIQGKVLAEKR